MNGLVPVPQPSQSAQPTDLDGVNVTQDRRRLLCDANRQGRQVVESAVGFMDLSEQRPGLVQDFSPPRMGKAEPVPQADSFRWRLEQHEPCPVRPLTEGKQTRP
jgi:hypothetical protein